MPEVQYPFDDIICNGRPVPLRDIVEGLGDSDSFEHSLFSFIRAWLSDTPGFELKTSGSTGPPKRITVTREQMIRSAQRTAKAIGLRPGDSAFLCLNPDYIAGKMMAVRCFTTGLRLIAASPRSLPLSALPAPVDFAAMVPLQVHDTIRNGKPELFDVVGKIIVGGGALDARSTQAIQRTTCVFYASYGMTETVSHVALRRLNGPEAAPWYRAVPGVRFSKDTRGCLVIHDDAMGSSLASNDLVDLVDDERFTWLGRWDNVINSGGKKLIPEQLEMIIAPILEQRSPGARFFISGVADERLGRKAVLILEGMWTTDGLNAVRESIKTVLDKHEMPKAIFCCPAFIEGATAKIDRNATLELAISLSRSPD